MADFKPSREVPDMLPAHPPDICGSSERFLRGYGSALHTDQRPHGPYRQDQKDDFRPVVDSKKTYFGGFLGGKEELKVGNQRHFPGGKRKPVTTYQEPFQNSFLENIFTKLFF